MRYLLLSCFTLCSLFSFSQTTPKIRAKKESTLVFFQKGVKSDTLMKNKHNLFYLRVPDSLKKHLSIQTDNGQLQPFGGDSIYKFTYLFGLRYESLFIKQSYMDQTGFRTLINGTSEAEANTIRIRFFDKSEDKLMLENRFIYRPE